MALDGTALAVYRTPADENGFLMKRFAVALSRTLFTFAGFFFCITTGAVTVSVRELGTDPYKIVNIHSGPLNYNGGAYAGVVNLLVDGKPMDGFCIDPFHFSNPSTVTAPYQVVPLSSAPKTPGPMTPAAASEIALLYAYVYALPENAGKPHGITAENAAGLQIAIWQIIAASTGGDFSLMPGQQDFGAQGFRNIVEAPGYTGPKANLIALKTVGASGQDYLVPNVPDGGATALLLVFGTTALLAFRRKG
jgi:hypothetical protein